MQTAVLRIGTRASPLALAQAHEARDRLMAAHGLPKEAFAIVAMTTTGDRIHGRPLAEAGGKGLFTRELDDALLAGEIDLAVHSCKDVPTKLPAGLELACFLEREDPRDAFLSQTVATLAALPTGALVGSSSLRRQALIRRLRPDLRVTTFRGNVQTRLRKLADRQVDGTLLAVAGLKRVGLEHVISERLALDAFPPAPGQGAIGIEIRGGDPEMAEKVRAIHDETTGYALVCERAFLDALDGSCRTPIAAHARIDADRIHFFGMILTPDGAQWHDVTAEGSVADAEAIGRDAGERVRGQAGERFFDSWT